MSITSDPISTRRRLLSFVLAALAIAGLATVPAAPAQAQATPRAFDAVTTQREGDFWKHLGLKRDRYIIFNDGRVFEQGIIRNKWPFLPSQFHSDLDAAAVVMEGRVWRYLFVKDNQVAYFTDGGFISGGWPPLTFLPEPYRSDMDALSAYYLERIPSYTVSRGNTLLSFNNGQLFTPFQLPAVIPQDFRSGFDDISVEQEGLSVKVSLYKGFERLIYVEEAFGSTFVIERLNLRNKWPHLNSFFNSTA